MAGPTIKCSPKPASFTDFSAYSFLLADEKISMWEKKSKATEAIWDSLHKNRKPYKFFVLQAALETNM